MSAAYTAEPPELNSAAGEVLIMIQLSEGTILTRAIRDEFMNEVQAKLSHGSLPLENHWEIFQREDHDSMTQTLSVTSTEMRWSRDMVSRKSRFVHGVLRLAALLGRSPHGSVGFSRNHIHILIRVVP